MMSDQKKSITEKIAETFIEPINQRLTNPFISSLLISWIFINWKPILYIIFAKGEIANKILYIEYYFYTTDQENLIRYFGAPILISLLYCFGLQHFNVLVDKFNRKPNEHNDNKKHSTLLNHYKKETLYAEQIYRRDEALAGSKNAEAIIQEREHWKKNLEDKDVQIQQKQEEIDKYVEQLNSANALHSEQNTKMSAEVSNLQKKANALDLEKIDKIHQISSLNAQLADANNVIKDLQLNIHKLKEENEFTNNELIYARQTAIDQKSENEFLINEKKNIEVKLISSVQEAKKLSDIMEKRLEEAVRYNIDKENELSNSLERIDHLEIQLAAETSEKYKLSKQNTIFKDYFVDRNIIFPDDID